jgi:hypothetical protein
MTMLVRPEIPEAEIDVFCKKAGRLTLAQIVDKVTVKETLVTNGHTRIKNFTVSLAFYPASEYTAEYGVDVVEVLSAFGTKFSLILKKEIQNELRKFDQDMKSQMANVGRGKVVRERAGLEGADGAEEGEEDAAEPSGRSKDVDEESEVGDGDASAAKRQRQTQEQASYEEDENDEDDEDDIAMKDDEIEAAYASDHNSSEDDKLPEGTTAADLEEQIEAVEQTFMDNFPQARSFDFRDSGCIIDLQVSWR